MAKLFETGTRCGAEFSPCRTYRYSLTRGWDDTLPCVMFIGLNPSTADETKDDPTIRRCIQFAKDWGFGGLIMANLFAFRATDPKDMKRAADPVGPDNDSWLRELKDRAGLVIAAWGAHGTFAERSEKVLAMFPDAGCLGKTANGQPKHPLYIPGDSVYRPVVSSNA